MPWYEASEATVYAANVAMRETAESGIGAAEKSARIEAIWRPVAQALTESIRPELPTNWPEQWRIAKSLGADFVGQTSDTGRIVSWGAELTVPDADFTWRAFVIHDHPAERR